MKVELREVLALATRAEESGQPNVAAGLYEVAGRMDRVPGWDGYDDEERRDAAVALGMARARRAFAAEGMVAR